MLIRNHIRTAIRSERRAQFFLLAGVLAVIAMACAAVPAEQPAPDEAQIRALLEDQTAAWNRGDIEGFMAGYWKSEQTEFVSSEGVSHGWQMLLDRYRHTYPDRKAMGHLSFSNLEIRVECPSSAYAVGEYHLQRETDNPSGVFTLNFRKFPEGWRVVLDHTSSSAQTSPASKRE
jgi:ketosteroid isomerase-like protein